MTRRQLLAATASASAAFTFDRVFAQTPPAQLRNMGGAPAGFGAHSSGGRGGLGAPARGAAPGGGRGAAGGGRGPAFDFLGYFHGLGFGVAEGARPASNDPDAIKAFRARVEEYHMRVILDVGYPRDENGLEAFEASVKMAKEAGAISLHAAMTQRRYEEFNDFAAFKASFERNQKSIAMAEPVLRKYQMRLGLENHKGWRSAEQAAWLKRLGSEWVGVHFDFGNNVSLCEDPADTLKNLLPYTFACHIKDMAVEPYEDGFLLSEVPLGDGILDLARWVAALSQRDPRIPFDLETITRDPLKIPVFTKKYWATFDDSYSPLPGRDLARVLEIVHRNPPKKPLPRTYGLSEEQQTRLEAENNLMSIRYARQTLHL